MYDILRKKKPEESIRQHVIDWMVGKLGYPKSNIVIEKQLDFFPSLSQFLPQKKSIPSRRIDIVCLMKQIDRFLPLLIVECKALGTMDKAWQQVQGYNYYVQAPYLAVASPRGVFWKIHGEDKISRGLPAYSELVDHLL